MQNHVVGVTDLLSEMCKNERREKDVDSSRQNINVIISNCIFLNLNLNYKRY